MKVVVDNKIIRKRMIDMGINSITDLSKKSGISKPKIHEYLRGDTPLATTYIRLCSFLSLNPEETLVLIDDCEDTDNEKQHNI